MSDVVLFPDDAVVPIRLADGVVTALSRAILEGRLRPGDPLPAESRLAERFGVSKQVVREAVRQLAALGALQVGQGKSTRVAATADVGPLARYWQFAAAGSRAGLAQAVELRRVVEPGVARLAAERADGEGIAGMRAILARMEAAMGDVPRWIPADLDFHDHLGRMTGNALVHLQVQGLRPVVQELLRRFNDRGTRTEPDWRATLARHVAVLDAIVARDPARAERAMLAHFEAAETAITEIFGGATPPQREEEP
ncbi:FadR/GntR family transcriptional regulator [Roseomonas sp. CCTCC AB2023176]|uniref:FadR/GntR family transcriptional regulator n=1 Tax=Roseomonas sp. CCTCC AB2023176 TaxID=3342640 RepID=UPI0035DF5F71